MDLKSGYPFWAVKNGLMYAFPQLDADLSCDVAVIGAGITGALIANELASHSFDVVVLEKRDVCWGSTSASTALLQYEIDTHATDIAKRYDQASAKLAYQSCLHAISEIEALAHQVGNVDFANCKSLYYASNRVDRLRLAEEFAWRENHGFPVRWLSRKALKDEYQLTAPAAILSTVAARVDPYRLASRLLRQMQQQGTRVFDRTLVESIKVSDHSVQLSIENGRTVRAKHLVIANGYEAQTWLKQSVAKNRSSYAYITDPLDKRELSWLAHTMLWESSRPYIYLRSTGDGRLLVGGKTTNTISHRAGTGWSSERRQSCSVRSLAYFLSCRQNLPSPGLVPLPKPSTVCRCLARIRTMAPGCYLLWPMVAMALPTVCSAPDYCAPTLKIEHTHCPSCSLLADWERSNE